MNILLCSHPGCMSNATLSCLKDPFGKSNEYVSYCPRHAPGLLGGTQPRAAPHCQTCTCSQADAGAKRYPCINGNCERAVADKGCDYPGCRSVSDAKEAKA